MITILCSAALCHHGGAGTTPTGFTAGVPSIIIPLSNDQFAWAHRAHDLGVGPKPLTRRKLMPERRAEAIRYAHIPQVREKARALGRALAAEDGARECARVIAGCLAR